MIFAMSDIHGHLNVLRKSLEKVDLIGSNCLILLGDYIDYGPESGQTLRFIFDLQRQYGPDKVIVLRGNHEEMFLEWLNIYNAPNAGEPDDTGFIPWSDWLTTDPDFGTFRTFLTKHQWGVFQKIQRTASEDTLNINGAHMIYQANRDLIPWLKKLPYYYETETQIFVHAGIDEEAGKYWRLGTPESTFIGKHPASTGKFYKDIIAGHVGTSKLANDPKFHGVYHDGKSHYYIDGTVSVSGRIPLLAYNEQTGKYTEL